MEANVPFDLKGLGQLGATDFFSQIYDFFSSSD